ncbi:Uncharacterized protein TCM_022692 [Theobroma cacao]|uniref:RNase H type-1 domain-containing protein n=1 Tax=Theobroma cacao TaxID=3641 RepID=A0A061EU49_THECC|nr:Uncharacterized protein TCM_022692 [Theobroma cacao]
MRMKIFHGIDRKSLVPKVGNGAKSSNFWKNMVKPLVNGCDYGNFVVEEMGLSLGNGNNIGFWEEEWIEGFILKKAFPKVYALANKKKGKVAEFGGGTTMVGNGILSCIRIGKEWDGDQVMEPIKVRVAWWIKAKWPKHNLSFSDLARFPSEGCLKFSTNGTSRGNPEDLGIDGPLRDEFGNTLAIFSKAIGWSDSNMAELLATKEAVLLFIASRWNSSHSLILEFDSSNAVKWIQNPMDIP